MNQHVSNVAETIDRNIVVNLLLKQGYNVFLPVIDDGIDFIVRRGNDDDLVKAKLRSVWTIDKRYAGRGISIAFPNADDWYLAPHDEMTRSMPSSALASPSWRDDGFLRVQDPTEAMLDQIARFRLTGFDEAVQTRDEASDRLSNEARENNRAVFERLREWKKTLPPQPPLTVEEILEMRDEGRRY